MTEDQKRKVQKLNQYSKKTERVEELELRIADLKEDLYSPKTNNFDLIIDGVKITNKSNDRTEKLMDRIELLEHELILANTEQAEEYGFILRCIYELINKNPEYSLILIYRYLDRMSWYDVAIKLDKKSLSTVHSLIF